MSEHSSAVNEGTNDSNKFAFFKAIIPVMVIEYFLVVLIFLYYRRCCCRCCKKEGADEENTTLFDEATGSLSNPTEISLKIKCQFEDTYESYVPNAKYVLFTTRTLSLFYICGISVIANYVLRNRNQWFYFTLWNAQLIALYFFLAVSCSIIGFIYGNKSNSNLCVVKVTNESSTRIVWSAEITRFAHIVRILFEVCGGNSFLVIAVAFILLDHDFEFWNVSVHFVTTVSLLVEMFFNNIYVRFDHFPLNLAWPALFLIFIWPIVFTGVREWPYFFLRTDTYYCFLYYNGLLVINLFFYYLWYGLSELKFYGRNKYSKYSSSKFLSFDICISINEYLSFMFILFFHEKLIGVFYETIKIISRSIII